MSYDELVDAIREAQEAFAALEQRLLEIQWSEPGSELDRQERAKSRQCKQELISRLTKVRP